MYILDTDHLSILDQDSGEAFNLGRRLAALPEEVAVTIITYSVKSPASKPKTGQSDPTSAYRYS